MLFGTLRMGAVHPAAVAQYGTPGDTCAPPGDVRKAGKAALGCVSRASVYDPLAVTLNSLDSFALISISGPKERPLPALVSYWKPQVRIGACCIPLHLM